MGSHLTLLMPEPCRRL